MPITQVYFKVCIVLYLAIARIKGYVSGGSVDVRTT